MKNLFISLALAVGSLSFAQVGINTEVADPSAMLEVKAAKKGFLPPRVVLKSINDSNTILSPAKGLIVYNTNNNPQHIPEGLYVNTGKKDAPVWFRLNQDLPPPPTGDLLNPTTMILDAASIFKSRDPLLDTKSKVSKIINNKIVESANSFELPEDGYYLLMVNFMLGFNSFDLNNSAPNSPNVVVEFQKKLTLNGAIKSTYSYTLPRITVVSVPGQTTLMKNYTLHFYLNGNKGDKFYPVYRVTGEPHIDFPNISEIRVFNQPTFSLIRTAEVKLLD